MQPNYFCPTSSIDHLEPPQISPEIEMELLRCSESLTKIGFSLAGSSARSSVAELLEISNNIEILLSKLTEQSQNSQIKQT